MPLIALFAVTSASPTSLSRREEVSTPGVNAIPQIPASFTVDWVFTPPPLIATGDTLAVVLHAMSRYTIWDYEGQVANLKFAYLGLAIAVTHPNSAGSPRFENRFALWGLLLCMKRMLSSSETPQESYNGGICTLSNSGVKVGQLQVEARPGSGNEEESVVTTLLDLDGQTAVQGDSLLTARAEAPVEEVEGSADLSIRIFPGGRTIGVERFHLTIFQGAIALADRYRTRSERSETGIGALDLAGDGQHTVLRLRPNLMPAGGPPTNYYLAVNTIMKVGVKMRDFARGRDWLETDFVADYLWKGTTYSVMKGGVKSPA